ncbi:MAG: DUF72 domain-containing protein [Desulfobacterales bacterium]|jgi:uncharacterized protein YecE (DUF72 family)|nr:DUF72 domain-containing protein [Desulfobacterales bacterium]
MAGKKLDPNKRRLWIGTSGYSYPEWIEAGFYPPETKSAHMLNIYAHRFPVTELNYTWYQLPKADALLRMQNLVPAEFRFAAKLTRTLTHEVDSTQWRTQAARYRDGIAPLVQSGQLMAVLVQLAPGFERSRENRQYLAALLDELAGLPLAVEFRHRSWIQPRVFEELSRRQVAVVAVDEPTLPHLLPPLNVLTSPNLFYIRFHGRNTAGWRSGHMQKKFDYRYSDAELAEWIERFIAPMAKQAKNGLLFFNNHVRGQAPQNAETLTRLLVRQGFEVMPPPHATRLS